ncbi:MAG TPA: hypothetical protein PLP61_14580, partial [Nocardioides sp.]|nr:hypothetical protein [Nocardioides sp.]
VQAVAWTALAAAVRAALDALEGADVLVHGSFEALDYAAGRTAGRALSAGAVAGVLTAPLWAPTAALGGGLALTTYALLPNGARREVRDGLTAAGAGAIGGLQGWATGHPGAVQHLANGAGGLVDGLLPVPLLTPFGRPAGTEDAAAALARLYPDDGTPRVRLRPDLHLSAAERPPAGVAELMTRLQEASAWSGETDSENNGTLAVQSWTGADGVRRHVVYLPGTDDLGTLPWTMDGDVRDLPTNLRVLDGRPTGYAHGVLQALGAAGAAPHDPVLLVGHSQGGLEAAWLAAHSPTVHVVGVVTAGSPIALTGDFPAGTQVLAMEHRGDPVPLLDGEPNPDTPEEVTVLFDDHGSGLVDDHDLAHYVAGGAGVDASDHPSVTAQLATLHAQGFLTGSGGPTETRAFQVTRDR